ncbi:hypothetical protein HYZ99_01680 [Candidatus Peregrinibacteria bacterium]|nr:hypothetical protein [Candidatus Peregrinibacteria bacterium]
MSTTMNRSEMNGIMLLMKEAQDKYGDDLQKSSRLWQIAGRLMAMDIGPAMSEEEIFSELHLIRDDIRKLIS